MNLGDIGLSDVLRTALSAYLITRQSKLAKVLGYLGLVGEIYALSQKETARNKVVTGMTNVIGPPPTKLDTRCPPEEFWDGYGCLRRDAGLKIGVLLQGYSGSS